MRSSSAGGDIFPHSDQLLDPPVPIGEFNGDFRFDGRFYQTVDETEYQRRQAAIDTHLREGTLSNMGIDVYQQWVELDWKKPHGTYEAVLRWREKLREEGIEETPDALYEYAANLGGTGLRMAAIEEVGDAFWTTCALMSNAGQSIDKALQTYLWGEGILSHSEEVLTLGMIDEIVADVAHTPWFSPLDAIDPETNIEHIKLDEMEPRKNLFFRSMTLILLCEQQFGHGEMDLFTIDAFRQIGKEKIAPIAADLLMAIAWYAHHFVDSSLAEVVEVNVRKLRPRVAANLIDKSDGDRSGLSH